MKLRLCIIVRLLFTTRGIAVAAFVILLKKDAFCSDVRQNAG